jgi:hypothetical protein
MRTRWCGVGFAILLPFLFFQIDEVFDCIGRGLD